MEINPHKCYHCGEDQDLMPVDCPDLDGSYHCPECAQRCDGPCGKVYCNELLKIDRDTGYILCEICNDPKIIAAMKATMTGNHHHLQEYLRA